MRKWDETRERVLFKRVLDGRQPGESIVTIMVRIRHATQLKYCPICGEEMEREKEFMGGNVVNVMIMCPEHGEITVG